VSSAADKRLLSSFLNAREPVMKNSYRSLDLIVALKNLSSRDQRIGRAVNAVEAWKRELATL
jgi:hypothetical protein